MLGREGMLLSKSIVIDINKHGNTTIKVNGAKGGECLKMTKRLEDELGVVDNVNLTDDYYTVLDVQQVKESI
jgi:hypothetical protein